LEYETTAADAVAVKGARLVVFNGNGYDTFMPELVKGVGTTTAVVEVVELSGLKATAGDGEFNEHVFYDMATVNKLADRAAEVLGKASPKDTAMFLANAKMFNAKIDGLRSQLATIAKAHSGARVAVTEPLPGYLTKEAGLDNVTPDAFAEAIEEGNDPSAEALAEMLALFGSDPVDVLILNTQTQGPATDQVAKAAKAAGVPVVSMSETLTTPDYIGWMDGQIKALAGALNAG
jgi:zinc/manganese transport system substrate-binding protein